MFLFDFTLNTPNIFNISPASILALGFINQFSDSFGVDSGEREFYFGSSVKENKSQFKTFECVLYVWERCDCRLRVYCLFHN